MNNEEIRKATAELLESVTVLVKENDEDIAHDYGSMDAFFDMLVDEVEKLRNLYAGSYKLSSKEEELLKKVTNI